MSRVLVEIDTSGIADMNPVFRRLEKALAAAQKELDVTTGKLINAAFVVKAPADVVAKVRARHQLAREEVARLTARLAN